MPLVSRIGESDIFTWKCLYKLDREELSGIVNDIKNGESYTVLGWKTHIQQMMIF